MLFTLRIQCTGGFVKKQHGSIFEESSRNGKALTLTTRKHAAVGTNLSVKSIG